MKSCRCGLLIAALFFCLAFPRIAGCGQILQWGYAEFSPAYWTGRDGKPRGELMEIGEAVLRRAGYEWSCVSAPVSRIMGRLAKGRIDLWIGLIPPPEYRDAVLIGRYSILQINMCAYRLENRPPVLARQELSGKSVLMIRGYDYGIWSEYIRNPANRVRIYEIGDIHDGAFKMLLANRADYLFTYSEPSEALRGRLQSLGLAYNIVEIADTRFVVSGKTPDAGEILENLEKAYRKLLEDGEI